VQQNKIIATITKNFRHKIDFEDGLTKINYEVANFYSQASIVGKGRLIVIKGSYDIHWKPLYSDKIKQKKLRNSFQEILNTSKINYDFRKTIVNTVLNGNPRLFQANPSNPYSILVGDIVCELYIDTGNPEKAKENTISNQLCSNEDDLIKPIEVSDDKKKNATGQVEDNYKREDIDKLDLNKTYSLDRNIETINCKREDIICISSTRWDFLWQRPHHLMDRLSKKNNRVLFFNHSVPMSYNDIQEILSNPNLWYERLEKISDNLWVFSPINLLPEEINYISNTDTLQNYNYRVKKEALKFIIEKLQITDPIIITYLAESINYIKDIPKKTLCYDCVDDFSGFSWAEKDIELQEEELIKESNIVITSAEELYNRIKKIHKETYLLPNAVEFEHFAIKNKGVSKRRFINRPVIGFVGAFYEWIDENILEYIVKKKRGWDFHFIGPVQSGMGNKLKKMSNVTFFGTREYRHLPKFISRMDVCIIPFKLNKITDSANPIKLWEYMASARPIVSTPIPEVKKFKDIIYIGKTKEEFLSKVQEAIEENSIKKRSQRIAVAKRNDWNYRVDKLIEIINTNIDS